jgi:SnoaL-like domain
VCCGVARPGPVGEGGWWSGAKGRGGRRASVDRQGFEKLLETIARAWSTGDPQTAAECFTEDAVYVEPPDRQRYVGRAELFELSGGEQPPPMSMTWHHLAFDDARQIGFGEYTFRGRRQYHGVVIVQLRGERISRWREYQYHHEADWTEFIGDSRFE